MIWIDLSCSNEVVVNFGVFLFSFPRYLFFPLGFVLVFFLVVIIDAFGWLETRSYCAAQPGFFSWSSEAFTSRKLGLQVWAILFLADIWKSWVFITNVSRTGIFRKEKGRAGQSCSALGIRLQFSLMLVPLSPRKQAESHHLFLSAKTAF